MKVKTRTRTVATVKVAFSFDQAHSRHMKKCADTEDVVYALISLQGQVVLKNLPLESVGQNYANLVGPYDIH